jgi:hypothetical protein
LLITPKNHLFRSKKLENLLLMADFGFILIKAATTALGTAKFIITGETPQTSRGFISLGIVVDYSMIAALTFHRPPQNVTKMSQPLMAPGLLG